MIEQAAGNQGEGDEEDDEDTELRTQSAHARDRRKAATDAKNEAFEEALRHRETKDYLGERRREREGALEEYERRKQKRLADEARDPVPAAFQYGTQKLQVGGCDEGAGGAVSTCRAVMA
jgi:hypothetical protein